MSAFIEPTVVYNINTGATTMNAVDANAAVSNHPLEWSHEPWTSAVLEQAEATVKRETELNSTPIVGALKE